MNLFLYVYPCEKKFHSMKKYMTTKERKGEERYVCKG
jgi:hypothetical protein